MDAATGEVAVQIVLSSSLDRALLLFDRTSASASEVHYFSSGLPAYVLPSGWICWGDTKSVAEGEEPSCLARYFGGSTAFRLGEMNPGPAGEIRAMMPWPVDSRGFIAVLDYPGYSFAPVLLRVREPLVLALNESGPVVVDEDDKGGSPLVRLTNLTFESTVSAEIEIVGDSEDTDKVFLNIDWDAYNSSVALDELSVTVQPLH